MNDNKEAHEMEEAIIKLLLTRGPEKTICPSEVVRSLYPSKWRDKMKSVRKIAGLMAEEDLIVITQKNHIVDINAKGPIRLKLKK